MIKNWISKWMVTYCHGHRFATDEVGEEVDEDIACALEDMTLFEGQTFVEGEAEDSVDEEECSFELANAALFEGEIF